MVVFKSIIVFDAETTSLPEFDHNTTKIIEVALIGCEIEHLKNVKELPRVLHKLVLVFNPYKMIQPQASKASGLTNELVMNIQPFREEDIDILRHFITRLPPPVCIVAHNGDNFDFPILRRALKGLKKNLHNNIYCADSLKAFQVLLPKVCLKAEESLWSRCSSNMMTFNETTPTNQKTQPVTSRQYYKVRRVLFPDASAPNSVCEGDSSALLQQVCRVPRSYKLRDIYHFFFGGFFSNAHRAEEDTKALLSCIKRCEGFIEWMNENAVIFNSIEPLF